MFGFNKKKKIDENLQMYRYLSQVVKSVQDTNKILQAIANEIKDSLVITKEK